MRSLPSLAALVLLFAGCASHFGMAHRIATITVRVPSNTRESVAADISRVAQLVDTVAERRGFALRPQRREPDLLYVVPDHTGGSWPGQPDVDWNGGTIWNLSLDRPKSIPDTIQCAVFPPKTGSALKINVWVAYASPMPPAAKAFWADLLAGVTNIFGRAAVLEVENLK